MKITSGRSSRHTLVSLALSTAVVAAVVAAGCASTAKDSGTAAGDELTRLDPPMASIPSVTFVQDAAAELFISCVGNCEIPTPKTPAVPSGTSDTGQQSATSKIVRSLADHVLRGYLITPNKPLSEEADRAVAEINPSVPAVNQTGAREVPATSSSSNVVVPDEHIIDGLRTESTRVVVDARVPEPTSASVVGEVSPQIASAVSEPLRGALQSIAGVANVGAGAQIKPSAPRRFSISFAYGSSTADDVEKRRLSRYLGAISGAERVWLIGYTDNRGSADSNARLARDRAAHVSDLLVKAGIQEERLSVSGYGSCCYVSANETPIERWKNRRVEIVIDKATFERLRESAVRSQSEHPSST